MPPPILKRDSFTVHLNGETLTIAVLYKPVRRLRMRVRSGGIIEISSPVHLPLSHIRHFVQSKSDWLGAVLPAQKARTQQPPGIWPGMIVMVEGIARTLSVVEAENNEAVLDTHHLWIFTPQPQNLERVEKILIGWWQEEAKKKLQEAIDRLYPLVGQKGAPYPTMKIRSMKTLWGSCNIRTGAITFNTSLIKAAPAELDYVVLHELAHLLYPNHGPDFHAFLAIHMPDYRLRRKKLKQISTTGYS